jgi:hypothetical protein
VLRHCADSQALSHKTARKYASMDALLQVNPLFRTSLSFAQLHSFFLRQRLQTSHTGNLSLMDAMRLAYRHAEHTTTYAHDRHDVLQQKFCSELLIWLLGGRLSMLTLPRALCMT